MKRTVTERAVALTAALSLAVLAAPPASAAPATSTARAVSAHGLDLGRQTLPAGDGWAAEGPGTTGGASAPAANTHTVSTRAGLAAALAAPSPKIIYVRGTIAPDRTCADYAAGGYTLAGYLWNSLSGGTCCASAAGSPRSTWSPPITRPTTPTSARTRAGPPPCTPGSTRRSRSACRCRGTREPVTRASPAFRT
ncbi:hypothetical protein SAMN05216275_103424 [Streptosporangium canum]|uniref:Uncharacterized protein n=1 Tax=Streptosporangium canum TaxID=324952 RepID=A0A1I3IV25_9ACTN|nr:hypothetical protein [Streptosporangium canum]SFI51713.1 hypothetical protein SAMN05216275_103424 [Streptosporangium canum]